MPSPFHPYHSLGISKLASPSEIKRAYRRLAVKYHPERDPRDTTSLEKFEEVSHAYEVLGNRDTRSAYDVLGEGAVPIRFRDSFEIFREVFGAARNETPGRLN